MPESPEPDCADLELPASCAPALLAWYDRARRDLPWRVRPGERPRTHGASWSAS